MNREIGARLPSCAVQTHCEKAVLDATPDAIVVADSDGSVSLFNAAAERMFGHAEMDMIGGDIERLFVVPGDWRRLMTPGDRSSLRPLEVPARRSTGEIFSASLAIGMTKGVVPTRFVAVFRDVSVQKADALRLRALEARLGSLTRAEVAAEVAAGIAHGVNQPLSAIATYAQAAKRLIRRGSPDICMLEEVCEKIDEQARRAGDAIRGVRDAIRRPQTQTALLDVNDVVADVMNLIEADAGSESVDVVVEYAEALPRVRGDAVQLQSVLLGLVRNAIEAIGATHGVERRILINTLLDGSGHVCVSVVDGGRGVSEDLRDCLFDAFVSSAQERLGVGLSIGRATAKAHDGDLSYESNPEGGAVFTIHLPPCEQGAAQ